MKEIVVISGKGGTGKTSVTASFAMLGGNEIVVGDCDVDAADLHLLLGPDFKYKEDFYSGKLARIDSGDCSMCGICEETCRFDAIKNNGARFEVMPLECEGCGYCARVCPEKNISMSDRLTGAFYISNTKINNQMVHARLGIGAENSGKMVAKVKKEANRVAGENGKEIVIIDGSPGIGCPVISSLTGADFVVMVTEPTVSGLHDLRRVYEIVRKFKIKAGCIINKYDLNIEIADSIKEFLSQNGIELLCSLPYDESFTEAMSNGKTIIEYKDGTIKESLIKSWNKILELI